MEDIKQLVMRVVKIYSTRDPFELAEAMGIILLYKYLPMNMLGYYTNFSCRKVIVLNSRLDKNVHRLTIAHELGHHYLHPGYNRKFLMVNTLYNKGRYEKEADMFAAELLVPDEKLAECEFYQMTIEQIAVAENITPYILKLKMGKICT